MNDFELEIAELNRQNFMYPDILQLHAENGYWSFSEHFPGERKYKQLLGCYPTEGKALRDYPSFLAADIRRRMEWLGYYGSEETICWAHINHGISRCLELGTIKIVEGIEHPSLPAYKTTGHWWHARFKNEPIAVAMAAWDDMNYRSIKWATKKLKVGEEILRGRINAVIANHA